MAMGGFALHSLGHGWMCENTKINAGGIRPCYRGIWNLMQWENRIDHITERN